MVIVCIREGFGNQLFTYACGYALSRERKMGLVLDTTLLDCGNFRKLELLKTNIKYDRRLSYGRREDLFSRAVWNKVKQKKAIGLRTVICREKKPWSYSPECFAAKENVYLYGFWQSYHYFEKYEDDLKKMIVPNYEMASCVSEMIQKVKSEESVAIHIRRGDYVQIGCTLPLIYYKEAIYKMKEELPEAKFYVFSDDIKFAKDNIGDYLENSIFWQDDSNESSLNDFFLMSACRHQIVANSTYSWWAAYLNSNKNKKVYAPIFGNWQECFYPESWNKIKP